MTVKVKVHFANAAQVKRMFRALGPKAVQATARGMYRGGEEIMTESKQHYVPVDHGTLKGSGTVGMPQMKGTNVTVELGYGGDASDYAAVQHENLKYRHKVGQAKYLEIPAVRKAPAIAGLVTDELLKLFKRMKAR